MHIMASGATVNATLEDAIDDPFFGEREAIALAYGENGSPTNEETTPHYSMTDAQAIALEPLVVPDTDLEGMNSDQVFNVTAADVVGYLGHHAGGNSLTDYYSFTATAGTLINMQVMSAVLDSPQGAFDTFVAVYDSSGNLIESNDNSFQDTDSSIIDLTLPETGTYYVEVTSSPKSVALNEPLSGAYELFMYTFATGKTVPAGYGDSLYAGSGDDTMVGGTATTRSPASCPETRSRMARARSPRSSGPDLEVSIGSSQTVQAGQSITVSRDLSPIPTRMNRNAHLRLDGQRLERRHGRPGTDPSFTFTPPSAGDFTVTYEVFNRNRVGNGSIPVASATRSAVTLPQTEHSAKRDRARPTTWARSATPNRARSWSRSSGATDSRQPSPRQRRCAELCSLVFT